jgi:hypothetical protein
MATPVASASRPVSARSWTDRSPRRRKLSYLIECDTKDEAVEWAKKIPLRDGGFIDVRPIWPM